MDMVEIGKTAATHICKEGCSQKKYPNSLKIKTDFCVVVDELTHIDKIMASFWLVFICCFFDRLFNLPTFRQMVVSLLFLDCLLNWSRVFTIFIGFNDSRIS